MSSDAPPSYADTTSSSSESISDQLSNMNLSQPCPLDVELHNAVLRNDINKLMKRVEKLEKYIDQLEKENDSCCKPSKKYSACNPYDRQDYKGRY